MKINEILTEAYDPFEIDDEDEYADVPQPKIKNIVTQLEVSQDFDGEKEISFESGERRKLPLKVIEMFLAAYATVKDKPQMTSDASKSVDGLVAAVKDAVAGKYGKASTKYQGMNPSRRDGTQYN